MTFLKRIWTAKPEEGRVVVVDREMREDFRRLEERFSSEFASFREEMRATVNTIRAELKTDLTEVQRRQALRDTECAGELAKTEVRDREIRRVKESAGEVSGKLVSVTERVSLAEQQLDLMRKIGWLLCSTTFALTAKVAIDWIGKH